MLERFKLVEDVRTGAYPGPKNSFKVKWDELAAFRVYASTR